MAEGEAAAQPQERFELRASQLGRVLTRSVSAIGDQIDNGALFAAFEEKETPESSDSESSGRDVVPDVPEHEPAPVEGETAAEDRGAEGKKKPRGAKAKVLKDKLSFVVGVGNIAISFFWLGRSPETFYIYYTFKALFLFGLRLKIYRQQGTHYYFFDFCYLVNALLMLHCWVPALRSSEWLWKALFACCAGPLSWSIPALRNSLVLHDFEKTVTLFMHWAPAVVVWTLRWYSPAGFPLFCSPGEDCHDNTASFLQLAVAPMSLYVLWSTGYYLKIFVVWADPLPQSYPASRHIISHLLAYSASVIMISEKKIRERGYDTVYAYMLRKGGLGSLVKGWSKGMQPIVYLASHCAACSLCFVVSGMLWFSFWAHTLMLVLVSFFAAWNGSCFYFDYFAFRYVPSMGLEHKPAKKKN